MSPTFEARVVLPDGLDLVATPVSRCKRSDHQEIPASYQQAGFDPERVGDSLVFYRDTRVEMHVGLGPTRTLDPESWRLMGAAVLRRAGGCTSIGIDLTQDWSRTGIPFSTMVQAVVEGFALAAYRFDRFKTNAPSSPSRDVCLAVGEHHEEAIHAIERAVAIAAAVCMARDLVNLPAEQCTPSTFASKAFEIAEQEGLVVEVFDEAAARKYALSGLLAVSRGSAEPPRLVRLSYEPDAAAATGTIALVGKGITFDSGGLALKTMDNMIPMKTDMAGAATVLAVLSLCRSLRVDHHVVGYMPLAENMPSGTALRPSDVLTMRNGKTIEVLNVDAEGRLVLADALNLAVEQQPDVVIDLATLTGACIVALGRRVAGVMGNDDGLVDQLLAAGARAGEPLWELPLPSGYRAHIDSDVADMNNRGIAGEAGAISAALLLREFVASTPWAHVDLLGPARSTDDGGYLVKGATGFGVRTLVELLSSFEPTGGHVRGPTRGESILR